MIYKFKNYIFIIKPFFLLPNFRSSDRSCIHSLIYLSITSVGISVETVGCVDVWSGQDMVRVCLRPTTDRRQVRSAS